MNKTLRWLSFSVISAAMLTQFTNCGNYADPASYSSASSIICDADCITETIENLSIQANTGGSNQYTVTADILEFNLGGDCNEGGYAYNTIRWELTLNGQVVRNSGMVGTGGAGAIANSRCTNGRFLLYVYLGPISEDNFNRQGLLTSAGIRQSYDLWMEVYGQATQNGTPQRNSLKGRSRISLIP